MDHRQWLRWARRIGIGVAFTGGLAGVAAAHRVGVDRFAVPLPLGFLLWGAGATIALTALMLAVTSRTITQSSRRYAAVTVPRSVVAPLTMLTRVAFLGAVVAVIVLGVTGRQVPAQNVATLFTWPVWIGGVALVSVFVGSPWPILSPWRTVYLGLVRLEGNRIAVLGSYPTAIAEWPALGGFALLVGLVEALTVVPRSPRLTAAVVSGYALYMILGAVMVGPVWFRRADPLEVFYRLLGRISPVEISRTDGGDWRVQLRPPWTGTLDAVRSVALGAFVVLMVFTVSFDGYTNTQHYQSVLFAARDLFGTGRQTRVILYLIGLGVFEVGFGVVGWFVEVGGSAEGRDWSTAVRRFAPTVVPIAAAYEVAHNYPFVLGNLGRLVSVTLQPITRIEPLDPLWWLTVPGFWVSQVVLIVAGHIVAVVAAHYVAADRYGDRGSPRRGHLPLVALMVAYTMLSLWIISQPVVLQ